MVNQHLLVGTLIANYPTGKLQLMPMPAFELIKDLSVNTGKWMDAMSKELNLGL